MLSNKDVRMVMVGAAGSLSAGGFETLNLGEVGAFTPTGVRLNTAGAATADRLILAQKMYDGTIKVSDVIEKAEIMEASNIKGKASTESIDYIGFNGSGGDIDAIPNNNYFITVYLEEFFEATRDGRYNKHMRATTDETPNKLDIALQLINEGALNLGVFSKESEKYLRTDLVVDVASTDLGTGTGVAIKFTKGSPYVTGFTDVNDSTGGSALAVGKYIRVGTALTDPVFKIVEIDTVGNFLKLDRKYQGETQTFGHAALKQFEGTNVGQGTDVAVGVKITGLPMSFDPTRIGRSRYKKAIFTITGQNFGNTEFTGAQSASKGRNVWQVVAEHEYAQQKFEFGDNKYEVGEPNLFGNKMFVDINEPFYDCVSLRWRHRLTGSFREDMSYKELQIFIPGESNPVWFSTTNGLGPVLNAFCGVSATPQ